MNPMLELLAAVLGAQQQPKRRRKPSSRAALARAAWKPKPSHVQHGPNYTVQVPFQPKRPNTMPQQRYGGRKIV